MTTDTVKTRGYIRVELGNNDRIIRSHEQDNLIVDTGRDFFAKRIFQNSTELISFVALGTSQFNATVNDTTLVQEIGRQNIQFPEIEGNIISYVATFPEGIATGTIREVGLFTNSNAMVSRTILQDSYEKTENDFLNIFWNIQIG